MIKLQAPVRDDLPSIGQLNRATFGAAVAAAVILVTTVLPAEYGVDPTGVGSALGLTAMGLTKQAAAGNNAGPAEPVEAAPSASVAGSPVTTVLPDGATEIRLTLKPFEGKEVKATMKAGQEFTYRWSSNGAALEFELHGDPEGAVNDEYTSYEKGNSASGTGTFRAPFDGRHGWYWKNNGTSPVQVTVTAKGNFAKFAVLD
jgi:hypothetical protein